MSNCRITEFDNLNVETGVTSRSAGSTFVVTDDPTTASGKTMTREEYARIAKLQDDYMRQHDMVVIDGYIGSDPDFRVPARLTIERANANIAGMQQKLYFDREPGGEPAVQVIYTPNLEAPGYPDDRCIAVDLEHNGTRVLNSDYFGESQKGGLRTWTRM